MKDKRNKREIDKNFFNQMNYEIAEEHGIVNNEEMKNNKKFLDWNKENKKNNK
ncbi:hypothetical protein [Clostridium sp. Cult2]|uniref:hypothetical protein n=1 Tax=Clostridium sp. Cult2 TaxID=2079003 RepID=UPI001F405F49|nr:hypothetical protein [Clostridium sp. Cult2]